MSRRTPSRSRLAGAGATAAATASASTDEFAVAGVPTVGARSAIAPRARAHRPWWRRPGFYVRVLLVLILATVAYVGITFMQVWQASRQDDAGPAV